MTDWPSNFLTVGLYDWSYDCNYIKIIEIFYLQICNMIDHMTLWLYDYMIDCELIWLTLWQYEYNVNKDD